MSALCPPEVIFAPTAVTIHREASTVPVPSTATPWRRTVAAAKVSCPRSNNTHIDWDAIIQQFACFCKPKCVFKLFSSLPDVDECVTGSHTCTQDQSCFNTQGGFRCLSFDCPNNYRRVGETWVPCSLFTERVSYFSQSDVIDKVYQTAWSVKIMLVPLPSGNKQPTVVVLPTNVLN